jgi:hypothetical protein
MLAFAPSTRTLASMVYPGTRGRIQDRTDYQSLSGRGWSVEGPLPVDTLFFRAGRGDFDIVVAMYHDQGHSPVKVLGVKSAVNIMIGLPAIRTSFDHSTAFAPGPPLTPHQTLESIDRNMKLFLYQEQLRSQHSNGMLLLALLLLSNDEIPVIENASHKHTSYCRAPF